MFRLRVLERRLTPGRVRFCESHNHVARFWFEPIKVNGWTWYPFVPAINIHSAIYIGQIPDAASLP